MHVAGQGMLRRGQPRRASVHRRGEDDVSFDGLVQMPAHGRRRAEPGQGGPESEEVPGLHRGKGPAARFPCLHRRDVDTCGLGELILRRPRELAGELEHEPRHDTQAP